MKICKIDGCEDKVFARGWCNKHYLRWYTYGDPLFTKHHGYRNHPLYKVWDNMKTRCHNKKNKDYKYYGGQGITICGEWKNNPEVFIEWALPLWKEGLEIDRRNNKGNYKPSNCRFVIHAENMRNQRLLRKTNTSGYRGVSFNINKKKWVAQIMINKKNKHLGYFDSPKLAALRYDVESYILNDNYPRNLF